MFDQIFERLGLENPKEKAWGNIKIVSSWPQERKIPGQMRIIIDPERDQVLANFLYHSREEINRTGPPLTMFELIKRAKDYVQKSMPYDDDY